MWKEIDQKKGDREEHVKRDRLEEGEIEEHVEGNSESKSSIP